MLLSTLKMTTFLANSLHKFQSVAPPNLASLSVNVVFHQIIWIWIIFVKEYVPSKEFTNKYSK